MSPKGYTPGKLYVLNLNDVVRDRQQPQRSMDEESLAELTASVKKHDVLEPILVRGGEENKFVIVAGERRYLASVAAGRTTIPAILTTGDPLEIAIVENLLRKGYTAIEEAEFIERLRTTKNYQLSDLALSIGKAESTLSEILSLNKLPQQIKDECRTERSASISILVEIAKQPTPQKMTALYEKYKSRGLTRGELRSQRSSLKSEQALMVAARTAEEVSNDPSFVAKFANRLAGYDIKKLVGGEAEAILIDLVALQLVVKDKIKALRRQQRTAQPAAQQPPDGQQRAQGGEQPVQPAAPQAG